ncbi:MAG: ABC transporter ATP-binding protein [Gemmatimonadetes bacterium]|nr:ABC transporter ATP-binding protein [Gemmatimonadota bacterium]
MPPSHAPPSPPSAPRLELTDLRKGYQEVGRTHRVLDGASLRVAAGERIAILGPSGSGKSTLLNVISGIDVPDAGTVRIGEVDLTALTEAERTRFRRKHIGFVFQFFNLLPTLTVIENLLLPLELKDRAGPQEVARARALLERVSLADRADAFPDRLSGGEQQRVALARALVHEPALVLADEPTGNLDEDMAAQVAHLLADMVAGERGTLIVVTHSRVLASRMDRVVRLDHGRLLEESR